MTFFDNAYGGTPTWDIGRPQAALIRLSDAGFITGSVIDLGCGTGENALFLANRGHAVLGVDLAVAAIDKARAKTRDRVPAAGNGPEFLVWDALRLGELGRTFDTAIDVGCFHTLAPEQRAPYAASVHAVLRPERRLHLLCWSDRNAFGCGPGRIGPADIAATFRDGWIVESIADETLESLMKPAQVYALLVRVRRL